MSIESILPLVLGLILFSFCVTGVFLVPFIDLLYKLKMTRRKEAPSKGKVPLFDTLHDIKAGTPIGGGILIVFVVTVLFILVFPFSSHMGVFIRSAYDLKYELFVIFFTFISFAVLGLIDDYVKIFGKATSSGSLGFAFGLTKSQKFLLQWVLAFAISFTMYFYLKIQILHIPLLGAVLDLGWFFIPFAAFVIVAFANAVNITDGLDGLSCGVLLICLVAFVIIAANNLDTPIAVFIAIWIGSLIAFLYFNVWPARIFLGDAGALSFGAMLAVIGLLTGNIVALVVIGGIFVIETVSSALQVLGWKFLKRPILPLAPLHHTLQALGWPEQKIVMRAWILAILLAIFGLWLATI
ncbi:MAG: phospho-N-acetylmuramoyl-pentapeptide-transferase [Patescibacteria group bacterium]|nr:phospho-N-acetylmuramoyl-pentapeptide-transferase [Patescibacteria group bacterium]